MFGERVTDGVESFVSLVRDYNSESSIGDI